MSIFGNKAPVATQENILSTIRVQTSNYGQVIPIVYGQNRIPGFLIWYGDFTPIANTSKQSAGGKGGIFGSGSNKTTSYTYTAAVEIGLCEGPIAQLCNVWDTKGNLLLVSATESYTIPGGGGSYQVVNHANYFAHYGVARLDSYSVGANDYGSDGPVTLSGTQNTPMSQVGSSPGAGQFSVNSSTATFTFSAADGGKQVQITYVYSIPNSNTNGQPLQTLSLTLFTGPRPQSPWSYLTSNHPGQDLGYNGLALLADALMDLGSSGSLPNYSYEILGFLPFGGGITDAEPGAIVNDMLTNPFYGVGWSSALIGDYSNFSAYCIAHGLFFSPVFDSQQDAASQIDDLIDLANGAAIWSEGVVKIKTYGDTTTVGNGATFIPNTTPIYDLGDNDFLRKSKDDPVQIVRKSRADTFNDVKIEFVNRANSYNIEIAEDKDDANISLYGLKADNPRQAHAIADATVAKKVANIKRLRSVYIDGGNQYKFTLGWQYVLLEPMDLITITDSNLGLSKHPVRITSIKENDTGELDFEAEDFPWGTASPTAYPYVGGGGFAPNQQADPGSVNTPIIFTATNRMTGGPQNGYEIWMAVSGAGANWGGCNVWLSTDGTTYVRIGSIHGSARMGVLTANLPSHSDPDTTDTLSVDLTQSLGTLNSGAMVDADNFRTACIILDASGSYEIVSYETATLTSANKYNLTYLRRGGAGSSIATHSSGAQFARLDQAIFEYEFDTTLIGQTLHFKFTSFNKFELMEQSLAVVTAYNLTLPSLATPTGLTAIADALGIRLSWNEFVGAVPIISYNVYRNTTNNPGTATKIASLPSNGIGTQTYYDKSASVDTTYFYWVTGVGAGGGIETAKSSVASSAGQAPGTHSSYRPTTNPLTATDSGSSATVNIAAFTMQIGGLALGYNVGSISSLSYNTVYYIYVNDPGFAGGSATYIATTSKTNAIDSYGQMFLGSILTPSAGSANTIGNNDGGAGAQSGNTSVLSPSIYSITAGQWLPVGTNAIGTHDSFSAAAVDGNSSSFGSLINLSAGHLAASFSGFPAFTNRWNSLQLVVISKGQTSNNAGNSVTVSYTTDDWNTSTTIWTIGANATQTERTDTINLPAGVTLGSVQIKFDAFVSAGGSSEVDIYEAYVVGQV